MCEFNIEQCEITVDKTNISASAKKTDYFEQYVSNTIAGSGNQMYFNMKDGEIRTGRIFYKIFSGGEYNYSILFSNIIDSTYSDGSISHKNLICGSWNIHCARIGKCVGFNENKNIIELTMTDNGSDADIIVSDFKELNFDGKKTKKVMPGEFFSSDPVKISFEKDEYLCLEIVFSGKMIPYHEESLLPVFVKENGGWVYSKYMPFAGMIGCDRKVKSKIAYLGDSITQGIGTPLNSYLHWNAIYSESVGEEYAFWNLGLGFGRANDAASDGAWLYKAKQNDIVFICFGVNDILQGISEEQIKSDLTCITDILKRAGKKVILQTIPPFDYTGETIEKWNRINTYIKSILKEKADMVFDNVPYLGEQNNANIAKFGGHPNPDGCSVWAGALYEKTKSKQRRGEC